MVGKDRGAARHGKVLPLPWARPGLLLAQGGGGPGHGQGGADAAPTRHLCPLGNAITNGFNARVDGAGRQARRTRGRVLRRR